jgi:hypothetical protein
MLNKICYILIKKIIRFIKYLNLDQTVFDKLIFCIGINQLTSCRQNYKNFGSLHEAELKIFSQNGEDGIIDYLIHQLGVPFPNFVEIGIGNYRESNTRFLYNRIHSKGLIIDRLDQLHAKVKPYVNLWKGDLRIHQEIVTTENISNILNKYCDFEIDLFSIDIDGIDYWVILKLKPNISKIFVAEYNPVFGSDLEITVPNISGFDRTNYHYSNLCYGTSLKALIKLMEEKNYYFLGTNLQKNNAFFISNNLKKESFFPNINLQKLSYYSDSNIRDSRDRNYNLNYLRGNKKLKEIEECKVINLAGNKNIVTKIKDLL